MNKMILLSITLVFMLPAVSEAQLSKSWEYVFRNRVYVENLRFINQDEIVFVTKTGNYPNYNIGFGKLNKNGSEDWYQEIDLGGNDHFYPPSIGSNNNIYAVGTSSQYDPFFSSFEQTLFTYSETGSLISSTTLNKSSYVSLGDNLTSSTFRINSNGDVISITTPEWNSYCSDGSYYNGSATYALNYYNYNIGNYIWEDGQPKTDFVRRQAIMSEFASDGSIIVLETIEDRTSNNCPTDNTIEIPYSTIIKKLSDNGSVLWEKTVEQRIGNVILQTDDLVILCSYGPWTNQYVTAYSMQSGAVVWTYNMTGQHIPRTAAVYNDRMLLSVNYTDVDDRTYTFFYLFDITTGNVLRTMLFDFYHFTDYGTNWFDKDGNIYLLYSDQQPGIIKYDQNFTELWRSQAAASQRLIGIDEFNNLYVFSREYNAPSKIIKYSQGATLSLTDINQYPLAANEFYLIRVADDAPVYTEDTLGIVKTDADGKIQLTPVP